MHKPEDLCFLPQVAAALQQLKNLGYLLICVTNQSGVARGMFTRAAVDRFHETMSQQLANLGVALDGIYVCPHHPDGKVTEFAKKCDCRKPAPGLIHQATQDFAIDLQKSYLIGDKDSDIACARQAGMKAIRIDSGQYENRVPADYACASLLEASQYIARQKPTSS